MFARLLSFLVCCTAVAVGDPNIRIFRSLQNVGLGPVDDLDAALLGEPETVDTVKGDGLLRIGDESSVASPDSAPSLDEGLDNIPLAEPQVALIETEADIVEPQIPSSAEPVKGDGLLRIDEEYIEEGQAPSPNEAVDNLPLADPEVSLAEVSSEIVEAPISAGELPAAAEVDETEDMGAIEEVPVEIGE
eukprot:Selendium_serpulae@DN5055_c1_g1_i2.p2